MYLNSDREKTLLCLADNLFLLSHRNSEMIGKLPELEIDMAIGNITLDILGQAQIIYQELSKGIDHKISEDEICLEREEREYLNCLLAEQPNHDFAHVLFRNFFYHHYFSSLMKAFSECSDDFLSKFSSKALKEISYHTRYTSEWVIRLGNGTSVSHQKMEDALETLWMFTQEFFAFTEYERIFYKNIDVDLKRIKDYWHKQITYILHKANLSIPSTQWKLKGGKQGVHSEYFGYMQSDFQFLRKTHPKASW